MNPTNTQRARSSVLRGRAQSEVYWECAVGWDGASTLLRGACWLGLRTGTHIYQTHIFFSFSRTVTANSQETAKKKKGRRPHLSLSLSLLLCATASHSSSRGGKTRMQKHSKLVLLVLKLRPFGNNDDKNDGAAALGPPCAESRKAFSDKVSIHIRTQTQAGKGKEQIWRC